jgi:hypothetical protein
VEKGVPIATFIGCMKNGLIASIALIM